MGLRIECSSEVYLNLCAIFTHSFHFRIVAFPIIAFPHYRILSIPLITYKFSLILIRHNR